MANGENHTKLHMKVDWTNPSPTLPIFVQATHAAGYPQRVKVKCKELNDFEASATSDPSTPFGTQFLNRVIEHVPAAQGTSYRFKVACWYLKDGDWQPSKVVAQQSIQLGNYGYMAVALANDAGNDQDYNDTVVMISMYNQSND